MTGWYVRHEGSPHTVPVPGPTRVLEGLRDGEWEPDDEVRGPTDRDFVSIEEHPLFADAVAELEPPAGEPPDDSHLDMNPLIDVSLVLLIFFILTASYSSLTRSLQLPPAPDEKQQVKASVKPDDIKDRAFEVEVWMEGPKPVIKIQDRVMLLDELEQAIKKVVQDTGRREMFAKVRGDVPWGIEAKLYDAAKAANINQIYWPRGK